MKCNKCGKEVEEGIKFCPYCGANMTEAEANTAATDSSIFGDKDNTQNTYNANNGYNQNNGYAQPDYNKQNAPTGEVDAKNVGFGVLGFFFPVIGLILWLVWKAQYPLKAKSCGKGALIGFIVQFVIGIIYGVVGALLLGSAANGYSALALLLL